MEQTVILNFEVDQSKAAKDLERTEKAMLDLKKEQADLNKQYKAGEVSQEQYIRENLKLQNSLKKENEQKRVLQKSLEAEKGSRNAIRNEISRLTKEYDKLNLETNEGIQQADKLEKELAKLNAQLTKGDKAAGLFKNQIGNYPKQFEETAQSINIAGTSVGGLSAQLAGFINPATAAVGLVTALSGLYASSAQGAKDSAFATDLLSGSIGLLANEIGELSGITDSGGEGIFSSLTRKILQATLGTATTARADVIAGAKEQLRELEVIAVDLQGIRKQYETAAEEARRLRDDEEQNVQARLDASDEVTKQLEANLLVRQSFYKREIAQLQIIAGLTGASPEIRKAIKQAQAESRDAEEEITGKLTENVKARQEILKLIEQQKAADRRLANTDTTDTAVGVGESPLPLETPTSSAEAAVEGQQKLANDLLKINKKYYEDDAAFKRQGAAIKEQIDKDTAAASARILGEASELFDESTAAYKVTATGQTLISTYLSAQRAFESLVGLPVVGPGLAAAAAAIAVAQGLQRVAAINGIGFAEGGFTGHGDKYEPAGIVHKGEYVAPQHVMANPEAKPHLRALENMRLRGYADGGFVTNTNISSAQQALITANALKNMPAPKVSWIEGREVGKRVEFRESVSRL